MTPTEISAARELLGWSREEMATALRCSWWTVRSWEMGTRKPSGPALVALEGLVKKAHRQRRQWQENARLGPEEQK